MSESHSAEAPERRSNDLTVVLLDRFRELLVNGSLSPGSRLPPERELAQCFGVSRNSLRQALKVLEVMGVVTQSTGRGTYLRQDASAIFTEPLRFMVALDPMSHEELFEARLVVEPELAFRAAERATLKDTEALRRALDAMENAGSDYGCLTEADLAFHSAVLRAAGNRMFESMFSVLHRALLESIRVTSRFVENEHTLQFHRGILQAIDERKPDMARRLMREHLQDAAGVMVNARTKLPLEDVRPHLKPVKRHKESQAAK